MEAKRIGFEKKNLEIMSGETRSKVANKSLEESRKLWHIAAPAILASISQFSIGFVTVAFVGHLGEVELAAVSLVQNVLEGFVYGIMLGMGSALETLSGQAVGAGQINMLGVYLQRSCIITGVTAILLIPLYVFTSPLLKLLHQSNNIAEVAGKYSTWAIPQLFALAFNFPIYKFFQSQSRVWAPTIISMVGLAFHVLLNWVLVTKLGHRMVGAAIAGDITWWLIVLAQIVYMVSGYFPDSWTGFSFYAFQHLAAFLKLSLASAIMLCLELWYYTAIILLIGRLKNPEIAVDAAAICMNLQQWTLMISLGISAAVSVRISNELGAQHPRAAKFSVIVAIATSSSFGIFFTASLLATTGNFPRMFTDKPVVIRATSMLAYPLAATILLNSIQPVIHGVAVGAGWQSSMAFINIVCYYAFGLPVGALLGYKFNFGVQGIWFGMLAGNLLQTVILLFILGRTNWDKEALQAKQRVRAMGGPSEPQES